MIVVNLKGGTGNQMFQYAAGRSLALRLDTTLALDLRFLQHGKLEANVDLRDYGLGTFRIQENILEMSELEKIEKKIRFNSVFKLNALNRLLFHYKLPLWKSYSEKKRSYNSELQLLSQNTLLNGYWMHPRYFQGYENRIREDFLFKAEADPENREMLRKITREENTVSLHIRRGDFKNIDILGVTGLDFYKAAIQKISGDLTKPVYFIFSDDADWVKSELQLFPDEENVLFVDINSESNRHTNDIRLMAACDHHIIGNSTFAWWGAWLNENPDKIVIAPEKLFNDPEINDELRGMIPPEWIRM